MDLDGFKEINDSLGHAAGDELLSAVAKCIRGAVRTSDTVARLGGDEFAVLLEETDRHGGILAAERVGKALQAPLYFAGRPQVVGGSIGLVVSGSGEQTGDELLPNADVAMYMAKAEGRGSYAVFEPSMHASVRVRPELTAALQRALERKHFVVHYQPTVDLTTGRIVGTEALVRWNHETRGLITPGEFIPLAEESGLIVPLVWWVLEQACRQGAVWQMGYRATPPLTMSVNLSMHQLHDPRIVETVGQILEGSGLTPGSLVLEITETALMRDAEGSIRRLLQLKELGVQIALDDFGTGYSSLSPSTS